MFVEFLVFKIMNWIKVVVVQYFFGILCKIDKIKEIVKFYSCYLVEDCVLIFGLKYKSIIVGNYGDVVIFLIDYIKFFNIFIGGFVYINDIDIVIFIWVMCDDCGDLSNEYQ